MFNLMRTVLVTLTLAISILLVNQPASAKCWCQCVNNKMVSVCQNTWDVPGYCSGVYCRANEIPDGGQTLFLDDAGKGRSVAPIAQLNKVLELLLNPASKKQQS